MAKPSDEIILSVRLKSGSFEASVSVPIADDSNAADFNETVARWLALTATALQHGITEMRATLPSLIPSAVEPAVEEQK